MTCRFEDSEAFAEAARGWNLDFRQLEPGSFVSRMGSLVTPKVLLTECSLSRRMEQRGAPPEGYVTFGFPMNDETRIRWQGQWYTGKNFMLFPPGGELDSISDSRFHAVTVAIAEDLMLSTAERREMDFSELLRKRQNVFSYSVGLRNRVRSLLARLMGEPVRELPLLQSPFYRESLEADLVELIFEALEEGEAESSRSMARERSRVLNAALDLMVDLSDEPVSIQKIEVLTGASSRTLRNAFQEAFGVSPKQYQQAYRLDRVQRRLRELKGKENAVSTAANEWGFWHMGQFAADYRRMFGELPSETLAK